MGIEFVEELRRLGVLRRHLEVAYRSSHFNNLTPNQPKPFMSPLSESLFFYLREVVNVQI